MINDIKMILLYIKMLINKIIYIYISTIVAQLVYASGLSKFKGGNGSMVKYLFFFFFFFFFF